MPALTNANNATSIFLNQSWSDREVQTYESENPNTHGSQRAVGWLVRGYLSARRRRAGPSTPTVAVAPATSSLRSAGCSSAIRTGTR